MPRRIHRSQRIEPTMGEPNGRKRQPAVPKTAAKAKSRRSKRAATGGKSSLFRRILRFFVRPLPLLAYWATVLGLWATIGIVGIFAYYATQLPSADTWHVPERPPNLRLLADDGSLIVNRGATGGKALRLEEMSPYIAQAVIAIEDRRFHAHMGFDPIGFTRAMVRNISQKKLREGGSTLTQQLAKNMFLKPERTFSRKVQELILAFWLEANYSKADILELYLNRVYFGAGATGVDAASRRYFGKSAKNVTIAEAALLAGLLKAPSRYTPAKNPKLAHARAKTVLKAMQREGYIKSAQLPEASKPAGIFAKHFRSGPEHFAADVIIREVAQLIGDVKSDIVVETTLSPYLNTAAQALVESSLDANGKKHKVSQAALLSMQPDGAVKAMIGGRDYALSQFNRAVEARRQPGSAFKTFVWLAALESGYGPQSTIIDEPVRIGKWRPENYDKRYRGEVTLSSAFSQSLNTVAARLIMQSGPRNVANLAKRMGITSKLTANASLALGTSEVSLQELTAAYAPFANGGRPVTPYFVTRISDAKGNVLYQRKTAAVPPVISADVLADMNTMLTKVVASGTGRRAHMKSHISGGKTGTSQGFRDAWFVGHTAHLVTGVWFGNDNNSPMRKVTGGGLPARLWANFMDTAHEGLAAKELPGASLLSALEPQNIPFPTPRPTVLVSNRSNNVPPANVGRDQSTAPQTTASVPNKLRARVEAEINKRAKRTILDLITGN